MTTGVRVVDVPGLRVVVASSRQKGTHRGNLTPLLPEITDALSGAPGGAMLATHHPPFRTGVTTIWPPGIIGLDGPRLLRGVANAHPATLITGGHTHRNRRRELPGHADHRGRITEGLPRSVGRLRRARRWHPSGRAAYLRPDGDVLDRTVRRHAHGLVALLVEGKSRRSVLLTRLAHHSTSSSDPITGWASMSRCSKPTSQGIQPRRSGHASCTTRNGTAP